MLSVTIVCLIIAISDGDTMKANCNNEQVTIRLAEIDAPERKQAFGAKSKQSLTDLCLNKKAQIAEQSKDRFGRIVARVNCSGKDANSEQVRHGMAWVYDRYVIDQSLYELQNSAQSSRRGLWIDSSPVPPWKWRKIKRSRSTSG